MAVINYKHKVTIGFPVYNVEKYVSNSLKSALEQDFEDFEILVVYDKSDDLSLDIVNHLLATHPNGKKARQIIREKKEGLGEARNTAIREALGKYIYFMDSDDFITPDAISKLYNSAEKYNAEIVIGSNYKTDGIKTWSEEDDEFPDLQYLKEGEFADYYFNTIRDIMPSTAWNILFKMDFLTKNNLLFPKIKLQEDIAFDELYHPFLNRVVFISDKTYYYLIRPDSLMSRGTRQVINIGEAQFAYTICNMMKSWLPQWKDRPFYGGKCAKTMRRCFYEVVGILKHRERFTEPIQDKTLRDMMHHPESLSTILKLKQLRNYNLFYYLLGILPPKLFVKTMYFFCHRKGFF